MSKKDEKGVYAKLHDSAPLVSVVDAASMEFLRSKVEEIHELRPGLKSFERAMNAAKKEVNDWYTKKPEELTDAVKTGFRCGGLSILRVPGSRTSLSVKKLLAAGVKASVIDKCYETSSFYKLVPWPRGEGDDGDESSD